MLISCELRLRTILRFCRMRVEVSQLESNVGCGDVYMMTATDRAIHMWVSVLAIIGWEWLLIFGFP